jgi:cytochrome c oxidase subunit III
MIMTLEEQKAQKNRSYKLLLIVAMVSMTMMFAGITSAFFVSKSRVDWMKDFVMPTPFFYSTVCILILLKEP